MAFTRNDQPFFTELYNTDQFTDPVWGYTVHDDGSPTYTQPDTGIVYTKIRTYNGLAQGTTGTGLSYIITLVPGGPVPTGFYVAEDGISFYVDESGSNFYVPEDTQPPVGTGAFQDDAFQIDTFQA